MNAEQPNKKSFDMKDVNRLIEEKKQEEGEEKELTVERIDKIADTRVQKIGGFFQRIAEKVNLKNLARSAVKVGVTLPERISLGIEGLGVGAKEVGRSLKEDFVGAAAEKVGKGAKWVGSKIVEDWQKTKEGTSATIGGIQDAGRSLWTKFNNWRGEVGQKFQEGVDSLGQHAENIGKAAKTVKEKAGESVERLRDGALGKIEGVLSKLADRIAKERVKMLEPAKERVRSLREETQEMHKVRRESFYQESLQKAQELLPASKEEYLTMARQDLAGLMSRLMEARQELNKAKAGSDDFKEAQRKASELSKKIFEEREKTFPTKEGFKDMKIRGLTDLVAQLRDAREELTRMRNLGNDTMAIREAERKVAELSQKVSKEREEILPVPSKEEYKVIKRQEIADLVAKLRDAREELTRAKNLGNDTMAIREAERKVAELSSELKSKRFIETKHKK